MSAAHFLLPKLVSWLKAQGLPQGSHLAAQTIADAFQMSRSPVNEALQQLAEQGVLERRPRRGYFLLLNADQLSVESFVAGSSVADPVQHAYFALADDLLTQQLPLHCSEQELRRRYQLSQTQCQLLMQRIATEGWAERRPGYGWVFSDMLLTPNSLLQSYRLRLALEPAALLEPNYTITAATIAQCRAAELELLNGGIETATADQLHARGVRFHEALVEASGNPFFIDAIKRVNQVRRLLSYRSMRDRQRYRDHCAQHLTILSLLERGQQEQAAQALREHLQHTVHNMSRLSELLSQA